MNDDIQSVIDTCNERGIIILAISDYNRDLLIQKEDGTPSLLTYEELEIYKGGK